MSGIYANVIFPIFAVIVFVAFAISFVQENLRRKKRR